MYVETLKGSIAIPSVISETVVIGICLPHETTELHKVRQQLTKCNPCLEIE